MHREKLTFSLLLLI